jgi:hypothetical protein
MLLLRFFWGIRALPKGWVILGFPQENEWRMYFLPIHCASVALKMIFKLGIADSKTVRQAEKSKSLVGMSCNWSPIRELTRKMAKAFMDRVGHFVASKSFTLVLISAISCSNVSAFNLNSCASLFNAAFCADCIRSAPLPPKYSNARPIMSNPNPSVSKGKILGRTYFLTPFKIEGFNLSSQHFLNLLFLPHLATSSALSIVTPITTRKSPVVEIMSKKLIPPDDPFESSENSRYINTAQIIMANLKQNFMYGCVHYCGAPFLF